LARGTRGARAAVAAKASLPVEDIVEEIGSPERTIQRCQKADVSKMSDSLIFYMTFKISTGWKLMVEINLNPRF
jgi:predicted transcriptional regulator